MSKLLAALQQLESRPASRVEPPPAAEEFVAVMAVAEEAASVASVADDPDEPNPIAESFDEPVDFADEPAASSTESAAVAAMEARGAAGALETIAQMNLLLAEALAAQQTELADREAHQDEIEHLSAPAAAIAAVVEAPPAVAVAREMTELLDQLLAAFKNSLPAVATLVGAGLESGDSFWMLPLAVAFAQSHPGRVVIVEADDELPRWPVQLGMAAESGIVDVLKSRVAWRDCIYPTAVSRIDLLPRGTGVWATHADANKRLQTLLADLKAEYSLVLVAARDASEHSAGVVAKYSDGAVLVVGLNATARAAGRRAKKNLEAAGARVVGAVVRN